MGRSENRLSCTRGSYSYAVYATKEEQENMAQEEKDVIDRYYFSRYGQNCRRSPEYRRRDCAAGELPGAHTHTNSRERLEEHRDSRFGAARLAAFLLTLLLNL